MAHPLFGGILIGVAALLLYAAIGRIAGVSGITFSALQAGGRAWRLAFLGGMIAGTWLAVSLGLSVPESPAIEGPESILMLVAAGLLVGAGTWLGNGCTSGHGVCGIARWSPRSFVAVGVFMAAGMATATLTGRLS